jgi:hypothetical protein
MMMYFSIFVIVLNFHILALRIWDMPEVENLFISDLGMEGRWRTGVICGATIYMTGKF